MQALTRKQHAPPITCTRAGYGWAYSVARTMFETDRIPLFFVPRCNALNEVRQLALLYAWECPQE